MKSLVRSDINRYEWEQPCVMIEPFPQGTDDVGRPYILDGYRYALCMNCPDDPVMVDGEDARLDHTRYEVTRHEETVTDGDVERTIVLYTAVWKG